MKLSNLQQRGTPARIQWLLAAGPPEHERRMFPAVVHVAPLNAEVPVSVDHRDVTGHEKRPTVLVCNVRPNQTGVPEGRYAIPWHAITYVRFTA